MRALILIVFLPFSSLADICVSSSSGNSLCFSDQIVEDNYSTGSWQSMYLLKEGNKIPLEIEGRYYSTASEHDVSPSGNYINVTTIEGGYVDDGISKEYVDRAYCNVIDMRTGCIVSDWEGSMCGYAWREDKDILSSSKEGSTETFDFLSSRPKSGSVNVKGNKVIRNLLRCEAVSNNNLDTYVKLSATNKKNQDVSSAIINFYHSMGEEHKIKDKVWLHSKASDDTISKSYLIVGDRVKVISISNDEKWNQIIYISAKGRATTGWIKSEEIN